MNVYVVLLVLLCLSARLVAGGAELVNTGVQCQCAGFEKKELQAEDKPLLVQNPLNTTCDDAGETVCLTMCLELAKMSEGKGPEILCAHLQHASNIQPSMFIRVCDRKWVYTGMTLSAPFCCHDGEVVPC